MNEFKWRDVLMVAAAAALGCTGWLSDAYGQEQGIRRLGQFTIAATAGVNRSLADPYHVSDFGFGADLTVSGPVTGAWGVGVGGRFAEHYVSDQSLLGTVRFVGVFAEVGRNHLPGSSDMTPIVAFTRVRAGYVNASGPGTGARGGGVDATLVQGFRFPYSRYLEIHVQLSTSLQAIDGRMGAQFGLHAGVGVKP